MGEETEPVCVPLCSVLCDPGSLFSLLPVHLQPPSCSRVCVPLTGVSHPLPGLHSLPSTSLGASSGGMTVNEFKEHSKQSSEFAFDSFWKYISKLFDTADISGVLQKDLSVSCPQCLLLLHKFVHGLCGHQTLCGLTLCICLVGLCPSLMYRVTQGRMLSRTQVWAQSHSTKHGEKSMSSGDLWQTSPQTISFPSAPCGTYFGMKSHHKAEGPVPSWLPQEHLGTATPPHFRWIPWLSLFLTSQGSLFCRRPIRNSRLSPGKCLRRSVLTLPLSNALPSFIS